VHCSEAADSEVCVHLGEQHLHSAFEKFTPSTLHNVPILKPDELTWSDVGALHDIRAVLQQTILWPTKVIILRLVTSDSHYVCSLLY